jgi:hypothetical protein
MVGNNATVFDSVAVKGEVIIGDNMLNLSDDLVANGSSAVTISSVAPAGVTTATISKWFRFKDVNNVTYYIPCWT